jgi:uncharacterized protein (TIGR02679 family)
MQAVEFFKATPGFDALLRGMFDTYARYGRAYGAVRLLAPSPQEEAAISDFFGRDYFDQALLRISLADFERRLAKKFPGGGSLPRILEEYTGEPLHTRAVVAHAGSSAADTLAVAIVTGVTPQFMGSVAVDWLYGITEVSKRMYRRWYTRFEEEPDTVLAEIKAVAAALNALPKQGQPLVPLSRLAKAAVGNSGGLDFKANCGKLLLRALAERFDVPVPVDKGDCINMYARAGILIGGMQSCVIVYGAALNAHPRANAVTFESLADISAVKPTKNLYVLEQPAVFEAVVEALRDAGCTADVICPIGGVGPAFMYLARLFLAAGARINYAGRLNYRGLEIADKLYSEFGRAFVPWRYGKEDFEAALAAGEAYLLPDGRRNMAMQNDDLAAMLSTLRRRGKTTDSGALVPLFVKDITQQEVV